MAWRFRYPRAVIARQLTALPTRSFATISSLKAQQPDFPCVDQHADRQARILADRQQRPPADPSAAPSPSFPCVDQHESRAAKILAARQLEPTPVGAGVDRASANLGSYTPAASGPSTGPEPSYSAPAPTAYKHFHYSETFPLDYGSSLPEFDIAYETWGTLSPAKDNVVLLHTGLSASSHAKSNADNPAEGWWESFIGPGPAYPIDTDRFFVICTNVLGGCYGSTGPSSPDPSDPSGAPYATRFPLLSIFDMVRAQFKLLDHLGVNKLYASIGSSMGGMQSLAAAWMEPERVGRVVSISGSARSSPASIALRYAQRSVLMADPNWNRGFYYSSLPPHTGMKLARQIATITYRSGPEWEQRFGRRRRGQVAPPPNGAALVEGESEPRPAVDEHGRPVKPVLCPDFLIETYLDHQGEQFCLKYDANSLIYVSKAMDLFDMTSESLAELSLFNSPSTASDSSPACALPAASSSTPSTPPVRVAKPHVSSLPTPTHLPSLAASFSRLKHHPFLVLGAQSDILFPIEQQREMAEALRVAGNRGVVYYELDSPYGHDTFLIDRAGVGGAIRGFLA